MKWFKWINLGLMAVAALTLSACGGGGSGGGGGPAPEPPVSSLVFETVALEGLGGTFSAGIAINFEGLAVGFSDDGDSIKGAKWTVTAANPVATELEPLAGNDYSAAYGVNSLGAAVGESQSGIPSVAVLWPAGVTQPTALSVAGLHEGGFSAAYGINTDGEIVGEGVIDAAGNTAALYWANSAASPVQLATLGGSFASAYFINEFGLIVGESQKLNGDVVGALWRPAAGGGYEEPVELSFLAGDVSAVAFGINVDGKIVGESEAANGTVRGIVWTLNNAGDTVASIENLGSNTSAGAVNDDHLIVGYSAALSGNDRAAIWNVNDLEDSQNIAAAFSQSYGVNNANQVVGLSAGQAFAALPVE